MWFILAWQPGDADQVQAGQGVESKHRLTRLSSLASGIRWEAPSSDHKGYSNEVDFPQPFLRAHLSGDSLLLQSPQDLLFPMIQFLTVFQKQAAAWAGRSVVLRVPTPDVTLTEKARGISQA